MIRFTAVGSGYFRVLADDAQISQHTTEREALESATRHQLKFPLADVVVTHDYRVLVDPEAPEVEPEPLPDEPEPPVEPPEEPVDPDPPIVVEPEPEPPAPPPSAVPGGAEFIIGPNVPLAESRWPNYGAMLVENAQKHYDHFMLEGKAETYYYDLGLVYRIAHAQTGDPQFLKMSRDVTDRRIGRFHATMLDPGTSPTYVYASAPRGVALGSTMLRASEERWDDVITFDNGVVMKLGDWITGWVNKHFGNWVERHKSGSRLVYGVRDGGYALLYAAQLSQVHPDAAVRAEYVERVRSATLDYYVRLQHPDGGWYWSDGDLGAYRADGSNAWHAQPFHIGLLLDGLIAAHMITGEQAILDAVARSADWLAKWFRQDTIYVPGWNEEVRWRGHWYSVYEPSGVTIREGHGSMIELNGQLVRGSMALRSGTDPNSIREVRQMVPESVHAFGYLHALTGDAKWKEIGDEHFGACFGRGEGPNADASYCLANYNAKSYNQSYRSSGRYEGYMAGGG